METLGISLLESTEEFLREQVAAGGYASVSAYVRDFILAEQKRCHEERIDALLVEGMNSGEPIEATPAYWENKRAKIDARLTDGPEQ